MRFGGWGPVFGDKGSGFSMGRGVLQILSEQRDRAPSEESRLWTDVRNWLSDPGPAIPEWKEASILWRKRMEEITKAGYDPRTALFSIFHEIALKGFWDLRSAVSGLAIPLMSAWLSHCDLADTVVRNAAKHLCDQYANACAVAKFKPNEGPVVFCGGILIHNPAFRELVILNLRERFKCEFEPIMPGMPGTMRPACCALLFALGDSRTGALRLPSSRVIETLLGDQSCIHSKGDLKND